MIKANSNATLSTVDRVGATVSFACAIHCIAMPLLLSVLPLVGLGILATETFERCMLASALVFAITSSCWGMRVHRSWKIAPMFCVAIVLMGVSRICAGAVHGVVLGLGGVLLSLSHLLNHRLCRTCVSCEHSSHDGEASS